MKYVAKPDTWFDTGMKVKLIDDYRPVVNIGLFRGYHHGKLDEELCSFDEFEEGGYLLIKRIRNGKNNVK